MDVVTIPASRKRLSGLAFVALLCLAVSLWALAILTLQALPAGLQADYYPDAEPLPQIPSWIFYFMGALILMFAAWGLAAALVAARMPANAYRLDAGGLYLGNHSSPAFTWSQVRGATLSRGKRRSAIVFVLDDPGALNRAGMLPDWLATFLGRPTDRDFAATNMDTGLSLKEFLHLIEGHLRTYGRTEIE